MMFSRRGSLTVVALAVACGVVAVALLAAWLWRPMMVATGVEVTGAPTTVAPSLFDPPPTPEIEPPIGAGLIGPAGSPTGGQEPERAVLAARLAGLDTSALAAGAEQLQLGYQVVDVVSGEVVAASGEDLAMIPASTTKLLTVTAAMAVLDGTERFATRVVQPEPGRIVLVGGGDPMLVSVPPEEGTYPSPPSLQELAALTAARLAASGQTDVTLEYDESLFSGGWNETWPSNYRDQVTTISALWADEGRDATHARSREPALLAAATFASQLGVAGITVDAVPVPGVGAGEELARVESLPAHVLSEQAMLRSNNSFTEILGRQVAVRTGHPGTFDGAVTAIQEQLTELGLWDSGAVLHDASGLSRSNRVTPGMLAEVMRHVATEPRLSVILDGLPVAGVSGTLADRFSDPVSAPARGVARAKTGTLSFVSSLAGVTVTRDGRELAFAFVTNGSSDGWAAKVWADQGTGVVSGCGC